MNAYEQLDAWIDAHFDEEVRFLQALVQVPTDTPPGNNAPHAERTAELLQAFGFEAEKHPVPDADVKAYGLVSITNLIVRRRYGVGGRTIALNAHGDVVPPGDGWTHDPYGGEVVDGKLYGRASAVSKSDFATYTFAVRALESLRAPLDGRRRAALHLRRGVRRRTRPGLAAAAGPDQARPADRRRLQLPGRHRAQRLPADGGHGARPDGARGHSRHRRRRAAGRGRDPERAVRAERAVPASQRPGSPASPTRT